MEVSPLTGLCQGRSKSSLGDGILVRTGILGDQCFGPCHFEGNSRNTWYGAGYLGLMVASGARSLQPYASCPRFTQTAEEARAKVSSIPSPSNCSGKRNFSRPSERYRSWVIEVTVEIE